MIMTEQKKQTLSEYKKMYEESETLQEKAFFGNGINYLQERYGLEKTHFKEVGKSKKRKNKNDRKPDKGYIIFNQKLKNSFEYIASNCDNVLTAKRLIGYPKRNTSPDMPDKLIKETYANQIIEIENKIRNGEKVQTHIERPNEACKNPKKIIKLMELILDQLGTQQKAAKEIGISISGLSMNLRGRNTPSGITAKKVINVAKRLDIDAS